eukprot:CAMPEP_0117622726 /NCGR_PEP_ID=MMETSP0784-20121206/88289_1 /TAXON_ID=39447 /ORGANISM="" /LENGTH=156 /DNA_ID=CAMNT_0005426673 /DNA_START=207 /DNA_END=677 /DNA_ORIENTATION=+
MDGGQSLGYQRKCGFNGCHTRPSDECHLASVQWDVRHRCRINLAPNAGHDPILCTEAHHHAQALPRCKHQRVVRVRLEATYTGKQAASNIGVTLSLNSAELKGEKTTPTAKLARKGWRSRKSCGTYKFNVAAICFMVMRAKPPVKAAAGDLKVSTK